MLGAFLNWADRLRPPDRSDPMFRLSQLSFQTVCSGEMDKGYVWTIN